MWLKRWGWVTDRFTVTSDPIQLQKDYNEWLAEEWNSVIRIPDNRAYTNPGDIRQAYREWLAEEWNSVFQPLENSETHPILLDNCCLVARLTLLESDKLFGKWVKENGFGDIQQPYRYTSMWLAEEWNSVIHPVDNSEAHPSHIRQAYREWLKSQEDSKASSDLPKAEDIKPTKVLTRKQAPADGTGIAVGLNSDHYNKHAKTKPRESKP